MNIYKEKNCVEYMFATEILKIKHLLTIVRHHVDFR